MQRTLSTIQGLNPSHLIDQELHGDLFGYRRFTGRQLKPNGQKHSGFTEKFWALSSSSQEIPGPVTC